jgi:hypothetical protein
VCFRRKAGIYAVCVACHKALLYLHNEHPEKAVEKKGMCVCRLGLILLKLIVQLLLPFA